MLGLACRGVEGCETRAVGLQTPNVGEYSAKEGGLDDLAPAV